MIFASLRVEGISCPLADKLTKQPMSTKTNHLDLPANKFSPSVQAFQASNAKVIDAIYEDCVEQGLVILESSWSWWNLEVVNMCPKPATIEQPKPTVEQRWAALFDKVSSN